MWTLKPDLYKLIVNPCPAYVNPPRNVCLGAETHIPHQFERSIIAEIQHKFIVHAHDWPALMKHYMPIPRKSDCFLTCNHNKTSPNLTLLEHTDS